MNEEINWYEEVKQDFTKNISDSYTLNLAMSILEDRKNLLNDNLNLQNNWNELKKIIEQDIRQCEELIEECPKGLRNTIIGTGSYEGIIGYNKYILSKMKELEQGKDE